MSKITLNFIQWYEAQYPEFVNKYGALKRLYDNDLDSFFIEEIDDMYNITEVYENTVDVYIGIGILTLSKGLVHHATVAELNAKRRLTDAEMALREVS
ncbi:hypothetical protein [Acinetobacter ursingii]|uniref:hypothetical protein n=1 Tax=Acinetobacter ursingii TaxID=108980 RepID=UPI001250260B|nr:hypothetical protein [Acinetobacter ursingii]